MFSTVTSVSNRLARRLLAAVSLLLLSTLCANAQLAFPTSLLYPVGANPQSTAQGDLDGDSKFDVVTANLSAGTVSVLLNNGSGAFEPARHYEVGNSPQSVALGDLDNDGDLDIVTANYNSSSLSILKN